MEQTRTVRLPVHVSERLGQLNRTARFCQISRQTGYLGWDVKPSPPRLASKNGGL